MCDKIKQTTLEIIVVDSHLPKLLKQMPNLSHVAFFELKAGVTGVGDMRGASA